MLPTSGGAYAVFESACTPHICDSLSIFCVNTKFLLPYKVLLRPGSMCVSFCPYSYTCVHRMAGRCLHKRFVTATPHWGEPHVRINHKYDIYLALYEA